VTTHLADAELRRFADGTLPASELLRVDDHLSGCEQCRDRAGALNDAPRALGSLRAELSESTAHLSDEEVQLCVASQLAPHRRDGVAGHLRDCVTCARQVEELRSWAATGGHVRSRAWLGLAAAIVLAVLIPAMWTMRAGRQEPSTALPGLDALGPAEQSQVRTALSAGVATLPAFLADLNGTRETLMGRPSPAASDAFRLTAPVGTGTASDQPDFAWQPLSGARDYVVTVFDEHSNVVARSSSLARPGWRPSDPLPRGRTYVWQVAASRNGEVVTMPQAPEPAARFRVIDGHAAEVLQRVERSQPQAHVLLGVLNMNAGVRDEAARQFRQVQPTDPGADVARRSLERLDTFGQSPPR